MMRRRITCMTPAAAPEASVFHETTTMERRRSERYPGKEGAMASFISDDGDHYFLCKIADISRGGIALEYTSLGEQESVPQFLEIFGILRPPVWIRGLPCKVAYNREVGLDPSGNLKLRRCGVELGELSDKHISQLVTFMKCYAACD